MWNTFRCGILLTFIAAVTSALVAADDVGDQPFTIGSEIVRPWGKIKVGQDAVEFHVESLPESRTLTFPRLNNEMKRLYIKDRPSPSDELRFTPLIETWQIAIDQKSEFSSGVIIFETKQPIRWSDEPVVVSASEDHSVVLPARHAETHGELLRYEPQPHKNTVGYWANAKDWMEWRFTVETVGEFEIEVLQGCGKGHGGSEVSVSVAEQTLKFVVEDTGHFQNFVPRRIGAVTIDSAGQQTLQVRAISKAKGAVCDIRQIRLLPVVK
ncbi:MAG: hypothetical protein R3C05_15505 [Pirellulaceae bacterium]